MSGSSNSSDRTVECIDRGFIGPEKRRIVVDPAAREVLFENCHWPRRFFARGYDGLRICSFEEITAARVANVGVARSLFIATKYGNCHVTDSWNGFRALVEELQQVAAENPGSGRALDNPFVLIPLLLVVIFGIVFGAIYFLL